MTSADLLEWRASAKNLKVEYADDLARLFALVGSINENGCWLWREGKNKDYPRFSAGKSPHRLMMPAARFVLIALGHDMDGLETRHTCDNRRCVNPAHLLPGTTADNHRDAVERGRSINPPSFRWDNRMLEKPHHWQKLKREDIPKIRERLRKGDGCTAIGRDFGVSDTAIYHIKVGNRWRHVP